MKNNAKISTGGGDLGFSIIAILAFTISPNLNAVELSTLCTSFTQDCKITTAYSIITNHSNFVASGGEAIVISPAIGSFINYGDIRVGSSSQQTFTLKESSSYIGHFINFGTFSNLNKMGFWISDAKGISNITNYGVMGSINYGANSHKITTPLTLNSLGLIGAKGAHIEVKNGSKVLIKNYMVKISETAMAFNNFTNGTNNPNDFSHLVINTNGNGSIIFKDGDSRIILDFGSGFEFGAGYKLDKLIVKADNGENALSVDFDRLIPKSDIYTLTQSGEYFFAKLTPQHSAISNISKSNIRTMNNFYTLSNSMIYPRKSYHSQNLGRTHSLLQHSSSLSTSGARGWVEYPSLQDSANLNISSLRDLPTANRGNPHYENIVNFTLDSAIPLKSYESFAYRNESVNRRIQRQNKRNYSRTKRNNSPVILSDSEESQKKNNRDSSPKAQNDKMNRLQNQTQNLKETQRFSQNLAQTQRFSQTPHNYYFILTPFFNHNSFAQSGNYNLRGFDYGFLTAFSTQVAESNSLGAHFIFSYGSLGDSKDKDLSIKSLNLNVGINYKLDLIYDMYLKARGDFFYFLNQVKTLTMFEAIKPNNLGFGVSVTYGKDFDFGSGGILGIEVGIDYKALKTNEVLLNSQTYKQSLLNLIYADVGINYNKYFGGFGINVGSGFKANLAPKLAESALLINSQNLRFVLDNDKYLAYANAGISYLMQTKKFDMEFSLAYYGNYGDRVISNGGGVEWRVLW